MSHARCQDSLFRTINTMKDSEGKDDAVAEDVAFFHAVPPNRGPAAARDGERAGPEQSRRRWSRWSGACAERAGRAQHKGLDDGRAGRTRRQRSVGACVELTAALS